MKDYCKDVGSLINSARHEIVAAVYLIRYDDRRGCPEDLVRDLVLAKERGVRVIVYTDDTNYNKRAIEFLREHNIPVYFTRSFLHAKVLKADDCFVVGSHNWTWSAMHKNLEASVIVCNSSVIDAFIDELKSKVRAS